MPFSARFRHDKIDRPLADREHSDIAAAVQAGASTGAAADQLLGLDLCRYDGRRNLGDDSALTARQHRLLTDTKLL